MDASEWALRRLSGTIASHLRVSLRAEKRAPLKAVEDAGRLAGEWGAAESAIRQRALQAIDRSPNRNSAEADALRRMFSGS